MTKVVKKVYVDNHLEDLVRMAAQVVEELISPI